METDVKQPMSRAEIVAYEEAAKLLLLVESESDDFIDSILLDLAKTLGAYGHDVSILKELVARMGAAR